MERYFPVVRSTVTRQVHEDVKPFKKSSSLKPEIPVKIHDAPGDAPRAVSPRPEYKPMKDLPKDMTRAEMNALLLKTLGKSTNPITNSDLAERSDTVHSTTTGHQRGEGHKPSLKVHYETREPKLKAQRQAREVESTGIFRNVRVYINGYLEGSTDIEIKRIVVEGGGSVVPTPSRSTHIITSMVLSGSKTQQYIGSKVQKRYVVKPTWVLESHELGKRRSERLYSVKLDRTGGLDFGD